MFPLVLLRLRHLHLLIVLALLLNGLPVTPPAYARQPYADRPVAPDVFTFPYPLDFPELQPPPIENELHSLASLPVAAPGAIPAPFAQTATVLSLQNGWNLIALPLVPTTTTPAAVFASLAGSYDLAYAYDGCAASNPWKKYNPNGPPFANTLTNLSVSQGLWVRAQGTPTLTVQGANPSNTSIPLCVGWNLVSFPADNPVAIATALATIAGKYDLVYGYDASNPANPWKKYNPTGPPFANTLTQLQNGRGYWVRVTTATTLVVEEVVAPTATPTSTPINTPTSTPTLTPTPTATALPPVADTEGPVIEIVAPADRQSVYTMTPGVNIQYSDRAGVNPATLQVKLNGVAVGGLTVGPNSATGTLTVAQDTTYTLEVTLQDIMGNSSTAHISFYIPPDPASITPPIETADAGFVSGTVYNAGTCSENLTACQGLAGVRITLALVDPLALQQVRQQRARQLAQDGQLPLMHAAEARRVASSIDGTVITGPDGFFSFPLPATGTYWLKAVRNGYTYGQREVYIIEKRSTATNDIYIKPLDSALSNCTSTGCTHINSENSIQIEIPPGAIPAGQTYAVNATNFEQVEYLPSGDLPAGTAETYAFNLGGDSEVTFTQPVTIRQANTRGFAPGTEIPLGFWNQSLQAWEHAGTGIVDPSGQWVETQVTHFSNFDLNFPMLFGGANPSAGDPDDGGAGGQGVGGGGALGGAGNGGPPPAIPTPPTRPDPDKPDSDPAPDPNDPAQKPSKPPKPEEDSKCKGCTIHISSGLLEEEISLPPVTVLGQDFAPILAYRSTRAHPSQVIDVPLTLNPDPGVIFTENYVHFELYIEGEKTDNFTFAANLQAGEIGRYRYLWDGRNAQGDLLPPGIYEYVVKLGIPYRAQYCAARDGIFGNPPDCNRYASGIFITSVEERHIRGTVKLDAQPSSPYGSGWVIEGQQRLYQDDAGRIMIADGQRVDEFLGFTPGLTEQTAANGATTTQYARLQQEALVLPYLAVARTPFVAPTDEAQTQLQFLPLIMDVSPSKTRSGTNLRPKNTPSSPAYTERQAATQTFVSGTIATNTTWQLANSPYVLNGSVTVAEGAILTIEPGVDVQFPQPNDYLWVVGGALIADGTVQAPIRFRGTNPTPGVYGRYLEFYQSDISSLLDNVIIEHMGDSDWGAALRLNATSVLVSNSVISDSEEIAIEVNFDYIPTLRNNLIRNAVTGLKLYDGGQMQVTNNTIQNTITGIWINGNSQALFSGNTFQNNTSAVEITENSLPVFTGNHFVNNGVDVKAHAESVSGFRNDNSLTAIQVYGGINGAMTWPNTGAPYALSDGVSVATGATLTIEPGVEVQFPQPHSFWIEGTLIAAGTQDAPIRFHGTNPAPGAYGGYLNFESGSRNSVLRNTIIEHMGDNDAQGYAVRLGTDAIVFSSNVISDSEDIGVYVASGATPTIFGSSLINNGNYGLYNQGPATIDARFLWWGSATGPYHPTLNPDGTGNRVSDNVDFMPWLTNPQSAIPLTENDYTVLRFNAADGTYTRVYPTGHQVHFNANGTHDYTQDPDGHRLRYSYTANGSIATITFTLAGASTPRYTWTFQYTAGKLTGITDPANQATTFTINPLGQLTQVNFANSTNRRFLYDNNGLLLQRWDEDGNSWRYGYDKYGRIQEHTAPARGVYNYATSTIEVRNETRTFTPSETGYGLINDSAVGDPANPAPAAPKSAALVDQVEFGRGSLSGHTNRWGAWADLTDAIGRTTTFVRDEANRITRRTEPDGDCVEFSYDERGNRLESQRMAAAQCALAADARNPAALQTWRYTYEARFDHLKTETDPLGNTTTYFYDYESGVGQAGRLVRTDYPPVVDAQGNPDTPTMLYTYNALGLLASMTDTAGHVTRYTYNAGGLLTQLVENEGGLNLTTTFQDFDAAGRPQTIIAPRNNITRYTYDLWGRVLTETDPLGVVTKYAYDGRGNVIRTTVDYTADGVSGRNLVTRAGYDVDNRLLSRQTTGDTLTQSDTYGYDINGNLALYTDSEGQSTRYSYDDANQLTGVRDALNQSTSFSYTVKGELAQITQANGELIAFGYDTFGNLASLTPPDRPAHNFGYSLRNETTTYTPPTVGNTPPTSYSYNALGQLTSFTRPDNQMITYAYDNAQRLRTVTQPRGVTTYSYNAATDQLTIVAAPGAINLSYGYDNELLTSSAWSGPINGTVNYSYDSFYRLTALAVNGANSIAYQYDSNRFVTQAGALTLNRLRQSRLLSGTTLGQVTDLYEYDAFGKVIRYQASVGSTTLYDLRYTYDDLDRIATQTESLGSVTTLYAYTYDLVGRLTQVKANGVTVATYSYDGNGNRLSGPGGATGSYDNQDRLLSYGGASYSYTANGELRTKVSGGQTTTYSYDPFSNLLAATIPNGTQIDYLSDGQDRRIGKKVNGALVQGFLYQDQLEPIAELDGSGNVVSRFVYASRSHIPDFMIKGGITYRIVSDHLGSVHLVVNTATGQIVQQMNYDEFGKVTQDTNPGFQPFGFAGGLYDRDTGLVRFGARDYDAITGRWTTKDPIWFEGGDSSLFVYVSNSPIQSLDLLGHGEFRRRPLQNSLGISFGPFYHEQYFNDDGTNIGHGSDGPIINESPDNYTPVPGRFDDDIMRQVIQDNPPMPYSYSNSGGKENCQGWADRLRSKHQRRLEQIQMYSTRA